MNVAQHRMTKGDGQCTAAAKCKDTNVWAVEVSSSLMTQTKDEANTEARESGFELTSAFITKDSQL